MAGAVDAKYADGVDLTVVGLNQTLSDLATFAPDLEKHLNKEIHDVMQMVADTAQRRISPHPSGMNMELAAAGYKVRKIAKRNTDYSVGYSAISITKPGAIAEFAGKVTPAGFTPQGKSLIEALDAEYGTPGRLLWGAWDDLKDWGMDRVKTAANEAEAEMQARLDLLETAPIGGVI